MGLARTAGRPAGSHCACDRVASGFHALRAGGRVRNPLVPGGSRTGRVTTRSLNAPSPPPHQDLCVSGVRISLRIVVFQGVASGSLYFRGSHQGRCVSGGRIRIVVFQGFAYQ